MEYIKITSDIPQIRLGLIGSPGSGKTTGALTFPNPLVLDFDRKLPPGVRSVPFYDPSISKQWGAKSAINYGPRNGLVGFILAEGFKLPSDSTLIIDSWTGWMNQLDQWQDANSRTVYWSDKKKDVDGYALHGDRISAAVEVCQALKTLSCHVVICVHEQIERNEDGIPTGMIKPLMKGQFADQMAAHLTAFFRAGWSDKMQENNGYVWRVKPDKIFRSITPPTMKVPESGFIPATYTALRKACQ